MFRIMQLVARTVRERRQIRPHSGGLEAGKSSHVTAEKCWRDSWTLSDFKVGYDLLLLTYLGFYPFYYSCLLGPHSELLSNSSLIAMESI